MSPWCVQIGDILSLPLFRNFEATAITLVRSERLSAEDKVALGTIKRFGEQGLQKKTRDSLKTFEKGSPRNYSAYRGETLLDAWR